MNLHGYKTFVLCVIALVGFFVVSVVMGHEFDGGELALVVGSVAALYGVNDAAGALRDRSRTPSGPITALIEAPGSSIDAPGASIEA